MLEQVTVFLENSKGRLAALTRVLADAGVNMQALTIAEDAYAQTLQQFIRAQVDAYSLSVAQSHWQTARQNHITSLQNYWLAYYHLRRLTLYDYQHRQAISHR